MITTVARLLLTALENLQNERGGDVKTWTFNLDSAGLLVFRTVK